MNQFQRLEQFKFWCQHVLPLVYDSSLSYYETLCKVVDYLNEVIKNENTINDVITQNTLDIEKLKQDINDLNDTLQMIKNGEFMDEYIQALASWIDRNIQELVGRIVKYVSFGLTTDGHFCAYIPQTWDFLTFDTIVEGDLYGHLKLTW